MLFALALIPVVVLLVFIYVKDKQEKEPIGFLIGLFFAGMATIVTALIGETIGESILYSLFPPDSPFAAFLYAMIVVAPSEELGKYMILRLMTWKNKNFNYSFDAIVYAVFVSLGFAAFENVMYCVQNGMTTAVLRMFTAVPGHACDAVVMGYFYSRAKYASVTNNIKQYKSNIRKTILVPIVTHGIYDAILMMSDLFGDEDAQLIGIIVWGVFYLALFITCLVLVIKSSKNDFCIVMIPQGTGMAPLQTYYYPAMVGNWTCGCGNVNDFKFCQRCGRPRPMVPAWTCPTCRTLNVYNFCGRCGCPKPSAHSQVAPAPAMAPQQSMVQQPMVQQPMVQQPMVQQPMVQQPMAQPLPQQMPAQTPVAQPMAQTMGLPTPVAQPQFTQPQPAQPQLSQPNLSQPQLTQPPMQQPPMQQPPMQQPPYPPQPRQ